MATKQMTRYQRAKYIVSFATATTGNICVLDALVEYPYLTDDECRQLASETAYSYRDIRSSFDANETSAKRFISDYVEPIIPDELEKTEIPSLGEPRQNPWDTIYLKKGTKVVFVDDDKQAVEDEQPRDIGQEILDGIKEIKQRKNDGKGNKI